MATVETTYIGDLRTENIHVQSGTKILTDAPTDNQGKGEAFSPTDLLAVALGTCMLTTIGIKTRNEGINIDGAKCSVTKIMTSAPPRRVAEIQIKMQWPRQYSEEQQKRIEDICVTCPVYLSLHPDIVKTVDFGWEVLA
ncbi:MAG: OsmC family protein [Bacteroidetes bacterium]|nr:OsmC family protein [Bacteroidota bacterium]